MLKGKNDKSGVDVLDDAWNLISNKLPNKFESLNRVVNGAPTSEELTAVSGDLISLDLGSSPLVKDDTAPVNFNLGYVPFSLTGSADWAAFTWQSKFHPDSGGPVWIIRNGLNDLAQDSSTAFDGSWSTTVNGNGALLYRVVAKDEDEDGDGLLNEDELKEGTNPAKTDSDGDGFSDGMEKDNGFDPTDKEDYPGDGDSMTGTLTVTGLKISSMAKSSEITFTTGGYTGTANGYYAAVEASASAPGLESYINDDEFDGANLSPAEHMGVVGLPKRYNEGDGCDVWVVIMKDGEVSTPVKINTKNTTAEIELGW
jgi:hypothetical protein